MNGVAFEVPFKCRSHEISYVCQSDMNEYFIIKFGIYVADSGLQPYAKFQIDIPVLSCPIGPLKIYGNITSAEIIIVTPTPYLFSITYFGGEILLQFYP